MIDPCRSNDADFILGVPTSTRLRKHVGALEASTAARFKAAPPLATPPSFAWRSLWLLPSDAGKVRRFTNFYASPASWSRTERIIARVEAGDQGTDTRFVVTNLAGGRLKAIYETVYCRRGTAENQIKSWKTRLAADRTSCTKATANQFRLFLHAGAYWMMWGLRTAMPKRSMWRVAQFDTLRLRLIKIAARVVEMKTRDPDPHADRVPGPGDPARRLGRDPAPRDMINGALDATLTEPVS